MARRSQELKHYFLQDMNPVVRFLIITDAVVVGAAGLLGPVFALFIENFIQGGSAAVAGLAAGIYLLTKSVFQIPTAYLMDRIRGEKDDFWLLFSFTVLIALTPLLYLVINTPMQLYFVQFLLGLFAAFTFPSYMAIFTRHIDKAKEGLEWGIYFTLVDLSGAAFAALGGYIASTEGFPALIVAVSTLTFMGALLLLFIKPHIRRGTRLH